MEGRNTWGATGSTVTTLKTTTSLKFTVVCESFFPHLFLAVLYHHLTSVFFPYSFHGCPDCTNGDTIHPYKNIPNAQVYADTLARDVYLRSQCNELHIIWEHEYRKMEKEDPDFKAFVKGVNVGPGIDPRDAFYGGRSVLCFEP